MAKKKATKKKTAKKKTAKKKAKQSAYQQLVEAGIIAPGTLSARERKVINGMSNAELRLLIKLAEKFRNACEEPPLLNFPL